MTPSRGRWTKAKGLLFVLSAGAFLLLGTPALGQVQYTGVPTPPPPGEIYVEPVSVDPYTGVRPPAVVLARRPAPDAGGGPSGPVSVASRPLEDLTTTPEQGDGSLVTGWDLVTLAGLGLTAVVAFAVSAGRYRAH